MSNRELTEDYLISYSNPRSKQKKVFFPCLIKKGSVINNFSSKKHIDY